DRIHADRELLDRLLERFRLHVDAGDIVRRPVAGSPLSGLAIDDELYAIPAREGPERIGTLFEGDPGEADRSGDREVRGGVRASAPDAIVGNDPAEQDPPPRERPAVVDAEWRAAGAGGHGVWRGEGGGGAPGSLLGRQAREEGVELRHLRNPQRVLEVRRPGPGEGEHAALLVHLGVRAA